MAIYLYCIIPYEEGKNFHFPKEIYSLHYKDIAAVVRDIDTTEPQLNEGPAREHDQTVRTIMHKYPIMPVAFGMAFKDEEILMTILKKVYYEIKKTLELLQNRMELGIKVISKETIHVEKGKTPDIGEYKKEIEKEIENLLCSNAIKSVKNRLFSDRLLLNESFLVEKTKIKKFSSAVAKLEKKYPKFKFQYSGPWPPYSFVDIKIGAGD